MNAATLRERLRARFEGRCGYCGVHEFEAGTEFEIDHFQPRSAGGDDGLENLVYCCTTCNRHKGDFWPEDDPGTAPRHLLHPRLDDFSQHLREGPDHRLVALTETGAFHVERLHLNRSPLVELRRRRTLHAQLREELAAARSAQDELRDRIEGLERYLHQMLAEVAHLTEP